MPRCQGGKILSRGFYSKAKSFWSIFLLTLMTVIYPGVISVFYSVHFAAPCCTQRSFQCPTEDGFSASLAKCPSGSASPLFESFLGPPSFLFPLSRLRGISPPRRGSPIATIFASSRLPSSVRQVWSLILQRGGKRSAEYTEQRYRVARSFARRSEGGKWGSLRDNYLRR